MSYQDLVLADSPLFYWPLETLTVVEDPGGGGGLPLKDRYYYYFDEIVNPASPIAISTGIARYAFRVAQVDTTGTPTPPTVPLLHTPGLITQGNISQWVTTMGGGARNTAYSGTVAATEDSSTNGMYPATGSFEMWFRWQDPLAPGHNADIYSKGLDNPWRVAAYGGDIGITFTPTAGGLVGPGFNPTLFASRSNDGASDSLADGKLHHIVWVFDQAASTCITYRDGSYIGATQVPGLSAGTLYGDSSHWLGVFGVSGTHPQTKLANGWNGQLGHVAVYSTKLTPAQIRLHWLTGGAITLPPGVATTRTSAVGELHPTLGGIAHARTAAFGHVRIGLVRTVNLHGVFAPEGVPLAGAKVWGVLRGYEGNGLIRHAGGGLMAPITDVSITDASAVLDMDIVPPGDLNPANLWWALHWTGGTPLT